MGEVGVGNEVKEIYENWQDIIVQNRSGATNNSKGLVGLALEPPVASLIEFMQKSPARKNLD
ncbi:hypothetical protein D3C86_1821960 [compost metagenome]